MYEFVIYGLFAAGVLWNLLSRRPFSKTTETLLCGVFVLALVIRFSVMSDTGIYAWIFRVSEHPLQEAMVSHARRNVLYSLLSFGIKKAFGEFRWLVLVQNILMLGGCSWVIFRYSRNYLLSFLLFIGSGMMEVYYGSGVRQGLAMTLFLVGFYEFLPKKKILLYELMCLLAFGFQDISLAVTVLPLLWLLVKPFQKNPVRVIVVCTLLSLAVLVFVYFFVSDLAWWLIDTFGVAPVWTHVIAYARFQQFSIFGLGMEGVFLLGILLLFFLGNREDYSEFMYFSLLVFLFSIWIYIAFACYDLMSRVSDFIQIISLVLVPNMLETVPHRMKKAGIAGGLIALNALLLYADVTANVRRTNALLGTELTVETYPYVCVFDTAAVNRYQVLLDQFGED